MNPVLWENLPWPEVPGALAASAHSVLWPLGATEQHGPHLALGTDTLIARAVAEAASARTGVPVLPALPIGLSSGHSRRWPGTLSLSPQTLSAIVAETGRWLRQAGVRRLILLNAHLTNFAPLRCGLEILRDEFDDWLIALWNTWDLSPEVRSRFTADGEDWHANDAETSLLLYLQPASVCWEKVEDDPDRTGNLLFACRVDQTSRNGVTGAPSQATAQKGAQLFEQMVEALSSRLRLAMAQTAPLPPPAPENL